MKEKKFIIVTELHVFIEESPRRPLGVTITQHTLTTQTTNGPKRKDQKLPFGNGFELCVQIAHWKSVCHMPASSNYTLAGEDTMAPRLAPAYFSSLISLYSHAKHQLRLDLKELLPVFRGQFSEDRDGRMIWH